MNAGSKTLLDTTIKEWAKFAADRDKMTAAAAEVAAAAKKVIQEDLAYLKTQNIDVECDNPDVLKVLGGVIHIDPIVDAVFPNVKSSVVLKCGEANRAILINPNMSISAGGVVMSFEQLRKAIPDPFATNAADFVRDAFLFVARSGKDAAK
ncbi:MAG: hypothetical protein A2X67_07955 [Ignavibacteria bacterium GWA2_55_11]|nr:MAG: hypothetical protein A2X67_07955 [Ignavibacteria bacterium GWA2_55_11]OGU47615.1 MAG: hypothetical protein A2X68_02710 [Ignavibacteria bacterium GWC2_56_12]